MKVQRYLNVLVMAFVSALFTVDAAITIPFADGSDGDLILTNSGPVVIDLSKARDASWNSTNQPALDPLLGGPGIYDSTKWAVVFRYKSVRIDKGVTLTFKNHPSRAPVVWLVENNVEILGEVNLNGTDNSSSTPEGGPGGFRGTYQPQGASGYRGYLIVDSQRISDTLVPLVGGFGEQTMSGGGAMLLASNRSIRVDGRISAQAGHHSIGGGGSIRILATTISGSGSINAQGEKNGVIRWEAEALDSQTPTCFPPQNLFDPRPIKLWPNDTEPTARIVSVEQVNASADPRAALSPQSGPGGQPVGADMTIRKIGKSKVLIETENFPVEADSKVMLFATANLSRIPNETGGTADKEGIRATLQRGTVVKAQWLAEVDLPQGYTSLQVHAVGP